MRWVVAIACAATGCASGPLGKLRYQNHDPIWRVDDSRSIPKPKTRKTDSAAAQVDTLLRRPLMDALGVSPRPLAWNINALGEVPDSTWFENRIGVRELSPEELARGPGGTGPSQEAAWAVLELKTYGPMPRMLIEDARGDRYLIKFDFRDNPEAESGADVLVQRLLWAAGYNVAEDHVVHIRRADLRVGEGAKESFTVSEERALTAQKLHAALAVVLPSRDGSLRALASKFLPGEPVGGYAMSGVRADDANDLVPHQHRREVRAESVFYSWLGATDVKENNTLDMWLPRGEGSTLGYLKHYLIDFGKALGNWGHDGAHEHDGFVSHIDYGFGLRSLFSFGLWKRPWEDIPDPGLPGVGRFESVRYRPDLYAPAQPYEPFFYTDRFDSFWAAQIIARFRPEHIRAAVEQAAYSDPRSRAYLTRTIIARQRKLLQYWGAQLTPLYGFRVDEVQGELRVCATDLLLAQGLSPHTEVRYRIVAYDYQGRALPWQRLQLGNALGVVCSSGLRPPPEHDGYTMLSYALSRGDEELPPAIVHVAFDPATRRPRVVGVERR